MWLGLALVIAAPSALAQGQCATGKPFYWVGVAGSFPEANNCFGSTGYRCYPAEQPGGVYFQLKTPSCDPTAGPCTVQMRVPLKFPGLESMIAEDGLFGTPTPVAYWFATSPAPACPGTQVDCGQETICGAAGSNAGKLNQDVLETWVERSVSCADAASQTDLYSLRVIVCRTACRQVDLVINGLTFSLPQLREDIGCPPPPPPERCKGDASCESCPGGNSIGGAGAAAGGPGGPGDPQSGRGAYPYHTAGGAGAAGLPGSAAWNATLGRHWSHDYAQRIVEDPLDPADPPESRVHLITEYGTYRTFSGLMAGVYTELSPSDEYRSLEQTGIGWTLTDLDGTVTEFDAAGLWLSTTDRNGNAKTAVYDTGRLAEVHFPDQRQELFAYHEAPDPAEGKLASITEVGIDGITTREWRYLWSGDDLERIERPDGTAVEYFYEDMDHEGYLTRVELVGDDGTSRRIERAWQYDDEGRVTQAWSGALDPVDGVDRWQYSYDSDTQTTVIDPLGQPITYTYDRDPASRKVRVLEVEGDCPSCGLGPNVQIDYDPAHPLRPSSITDGRGFVTAYTYTPHGEVDTRTEAATTGVARTTTNQYDPTYPALLTEISRPSVEPGQDRVTLLGRDGAGNVVSLENRGWEAGAPFDCAVGGASCYETVTGYNAQGQPESIDPPGFGTGDETTFTYDSSRGFLVAEERTDPLIGTSTYGHDVFNRRTAVTDPNGVTTETEYDELDRVTKVIWKGLTPAEDLITEHVYDTFGDLDLTILPRGNRIEYVYEEATGRLTEIRRWDAAQSEGERVRYELDDAGNRTQEEHQRWDAGLADWGPVESVTGYLYTTRCRLAQVLHADGSITEYDYDCNGNLERVWDANHPSASKTAPPTATYAYDPLNRLEMVVRPWAGAAGGSSVTTYGYDVQDHLIAVADAEGNTTTYEYSDRDLLTEEVSPVSGTTTHAYNEHGELIETTDARPVTMTRLVDELDRVTFVDYPDPTLDTIFTYDDPLVPFSKGRLTAIERDGHTIAYAYDRFGRTTQDGELTYGYDVNGNVTTIGYPDQVTASYTHDFADRQEALTVTRPAGTLPAEVTPVVTSATYLPSGPLTSLSFGSGAVESHGYDTRYLPAAIALDAVEDRTWIYTNDDVGNVTEIMAMAACAGNVVLSNHTVVSGEEIFESCAELEAGPDFTVEAGGEAVMRAATRVVLNNGFRVESGGRLVVGTDPDLSGNVTKTYCYQDVDYFLTSADGPWGSQGWTYDRIGNRLTETRDGATDTYHYTLNGTGGNTARLASIDLSTLGTRDYAYTSAGHVDEVTAGANVVDFAWDDAGRLAASTRPASGDTSPFRYDGRGFLRSAGDAATTGIVTATYDSSGLLHALLREPTGGPTRRYSVFYLAGRPVAQLATETGQPDRWWYLTTDHLGTPLIATDAAQAELWENRFEPFGSDPWAGTSAGALENEMYLRFPGQWENDVWQEAMLGGSGYYNVNRWSEVGTGRYFRPDPLREMTIFQIYGYAEQNPLFWVDEDGLLPWPGWFNHLPGFKVGCVGGAIARASNALVPNNEGARWAHCFASCQVKKCGGEGLARTLGLLKEGFDTVTCLGLKAAGRRGGRIVRIVREKQCESALQPEDRQDNEHGLTCPPDQPCEVRCKEFVRVPNTAPGPLADK